MKIGFALPLLKFTLPLLWFTLLSSLSTSLPYCFPVIPPLPILLSLLPFPLPSPSSFQSTLYPSFFNCSLHHLSSLCVPILLHLISPILFKCLALLTYMYCTCTCSIATISCDHYPSAVPPKCYICCIADTAFMFIIGGLLLAKIFQNRHPDVHANAFVAFFCFAVVISFTFLGIVSTVATIINNASFFFFFIFSILTGKTH